ncbi:MAG: hypothetical protein Q8R76_06940 [Candidatus Omnitrophota bacterium]|nr:hypothetical protein [Candidatus Omnitrophota bacterium]
MNCLFVLVCGSLLSAVPPEVCADQPVTDAQEVRALAAEYDLLTPSDYAYYFADKDIHYWAEKAMTESELRIRFQARQQVRQFAEEAGYKASSSRGELTAGVLSYWAERLVAGEDPRQIAFEFKELAELQNQLIKQTLTRAARVDIIQSLEQIETLAAEYGFFDTNPYAWTFQEGDIIWYLYQGMTEEELRRDFAAKSKVRELAMKTGFRVAKPAGDLTSGDLSYWAEFLINDTMNLDQMETYFKAKGNTQSSES